MTSLVWAVYSLHLNFLASIRLLPLPKGTTEEDEVECIRDAMSCRPLGLKNSDVSEFCAFSVSWLESTIPGFRIQLNLAFL